MAVLLLNAVPYIIQDAYIISESQNISNAVQQNDRPYESPIITSANVSKTITIEWPAGEKANPLHVLQERTCRTIIESMVVILAQEKYLDAEKETLKVPYTDVGLPAMLQATCAYIGKTVTIMGGFVESFAASWSSSNNVIIWNLSIGQIDLKARRQEKQPAADSAGQGAAGQEGKPVIKFLKQAVPYG